MSTISTLVGRVAEVGLSGMKAPSLVMRVGPNVATASADEFSALTDVPLFLGYMLSYLLQGILIVQVFIYYLSFRRTDPLYMKITVFSVFFTETLSVVFATLIIIMSIIKYGDLSNSVETWGFKIVAVLCGICSTMVHAFYSWRIRILKGSWWIVGAIMTLSVIQCIMVTISGLGVFQGQYSGFLGSGTESLKDSGVISINVLWLAGSGVADIIIATTLLYLLKRVTTRLSLKSRTATRVERVMGTAIDTGMITAIAACIELMFFLILPNSLVHFVIFYTLPKLYANCLMATLNARLTVPGRQFRESRSAWDTVISEHGVDDFFGSPDAEKRASASIIAFNNIQEVGRRRSSSGASFMDIERNFYAEVAVKRSSILGSRSTMTTDFAREYDAVTVEQAYRAQFVPATDVNLAHVSPGTSPNRIQEIALPESRRESLVIFDSTSRRNSGWTVDFEAKDTPEPGSPTSTSPGVMLDSESSNSTTTLSTEPPDQAAVVTTTLVSDSRSSSSSTIRLLPKIPTSAEPFMKLEPVRAPEPTHHF